ncbi:MAG: hypothetical protein ABI615_12035 [Chthoniobacterales bacterium]
MIQHFTLARIVYFLVLLGMGIPTSAYAKSAAKASEVVPPWKMPAPAWFVKRIPTPPAVNTPAGKRDLEEVIKIQKAATPKQIALAQWDYNLSVFTYSEVLGKKFTAKRYPQTAKLFQELNNLVHQQNDLLKNHYKRPHPFEVAPGKVKRIVMAPPGYSYPSYHSARCVVFTHALATLDPANKTAFERVSEQVEVDRVLGGEHFPSDIQAGRKLGGLIYAALLKDKNFLAALNAVKAAEWTPPPAQKNARIHIPAASWY